MKNWKRSIALCLSAVMMVGLLASCGSKNAPAASSSGSTASGSTSTNTEDVGDPVKLVFSIAAVPTMPTVPPRRSLRTLWRRSPAATSLWSAMTPAPCMARTPSTMP